MYRLLDSKGQTLLEAEILHDHARLIGIDELVAHRSPWFTRKYLWQIKQGDANVATLSRPKRDIGAELLEAKGTDGLIGPQVREARYWYGSESGASLVQWRPWRDSWNRLKPMIMVEVRKPDESSPLLVLISLLNAHYVAYLEDS